jgi:hypothetical protein
VENTCRWTTSDPTGWHVDSRTRVQLSVKGTTLGRHPSPSTPTDGCGGSPITRQFRVSRDERVDGRSAAQSGAPGNSPSLQVAGGRS